MIEIRIILPGDLLLLLRSKHSMSFLLYSFNVIPLNGLFDAARVASATVSNKMSCNFWISYKSQ